MANMNNYKNKVQSIVLNLFLFPLFCFKQVFFTPY